VSTRYQCFHVGEWTDGMVCVAHGTDLAKETDMPTGPRTTGTPPVHRPRINTILTEGVSTRDEQRQGYRLERTRRTRAIFTLTQVHVISDFRRACQVDGDAFWDGWTIVMDGAGQHGPDEDAEDAEFKNEFSFENVSRRFATCTVPILDVIPTPRRQHVNVYVCATRRDEEHVSSHSERKYLNAKFLEARGSASRHVCLSEDVSRSSGRLVWTSGTCPRILTFSRLLERSCAN